MDTVQFAANIQQGGEKLWNSPVATWQALYCDGTCRDSWRWGENTILSRFDW
jgi:hypothetical protein